MKVRLYGIDCPESRQAYGQEAKAAVIRAALFKRVDIEVLDKGRWRALPAPGPLYEEDDVKTPRYKDRYGRTVALVTVEKSGSLQEFLLESGLAWVYMKYCKDEGYCRAWGELEARARKKLSGLWRDNEPTPPWVWRKR